MSKKRVSRDSDPEVKQGFTIIEVMLVLAVSGLLLIGVLGGTYTNIATQRYNDSVRSFAEFLRQTYSEVLSPESIGNGNENSLSVGNSDTNAIYGKVLVFGLEDEDKVKQSKQDDTVYTATLVGNVKVSDKSSDFVTDLKNANARLFCGSTNPATGASLESSLATYIPLWQAKIQNTAGEQFTGTLIIARSPSSGAVRTVFSPQVFDLKDACDLGDQSASTLLQQAIEQNSYSSEPFEATEVDFCLRSENSNIVRDIRVAMDGRNNSAITIVEANDSNPETGNRCH